MSDHDAWREALARTAQGAIKATYGNLCLILRGEYAAQLAYNEMRECVMLDGRALRDADVGRIREEIERRLGVCFSAENISAGLRHIAEERRFHPVRRYLESLAWDGEQRIGRLLGDVFRMPSNGLFEAYLLRWLVGCVARVLDPGCKLDTALVLVGNQGWRKSTFFEILGGEWFSDSAVDISTRQGLLQIAAAWIYEWGELETITTKKGMAEVKAFLSSRKDTFVPPYGRAVIEHRRMTVIVGSTNETQFLTDPTGSRRFWIIPAKYRLDWRLLQSWRDQLFAEAVVKYREGHSWWLDDDEDAARQSDAGDYHAEEAWLPHVQAWLLTWHSRERFPNKDPDDALTTTRILAGAVDVEPAKQDRVAQIRIGGIMRGLGFESVKAWVGEGEERRNIRVWRKREEQG